MVSDPGASDISPRHVIRGPRVCPDPRQHHDAGGLPLAPAVQRPQEGGAAEPRRTRPGPLAHRYVPLALWATHVLYDGVASEHVSGALRCWWWSTGQQSPELFQVIMQHQDEFIAMMNEPITETAPRAAPTGSIPGAPPTGGAPLGESRRHTYKPRQTA